MLEMVGTVDLDKDEGWEPWDRFVSWEGFG